MHRLPAQILCGGILPPHPARSQRQRGCVQCNAAGQNSGFRKGLAWCWMQVFSSWLAAGAAVLAIMWAWHRPGGWRVWATTPGQQALATFPVLQA